MKSLKYKTLNGFIWVLTGNFSKSIIGVIVGITMAQFILPEEFGLMAMLSLFLGISTIFINSGFSAAIIREQNITNKDLSTIFIFNLFLGFLFSLIMYISSEWIGNFFNSNQLIQVSQIMSFNLFLNSFVIVQSAIFEKNMRFKELTIINLVVIVTSSIIGIIMAIYGFGVWSLVAVSLSNTMIRGLLMWFTLQWRPLLYFKFRILKKYFYFSAYLTLISLLNTFFENLYQVLIGKYFTLTDAGLFSRAQGYNNLITTSLISMLNKVLFPSFSKISKDKVLFEKSIVKVIGMLSFLIVPITIIMILTIEPIVHVVFPETWWLLSDYLELFFIASLARPAGRILSNVPLIYNDSKIVFYMTIMHKVLLLVSIFITFSWGINAMLVGYIVVAFIDMILKFHFYGAMINYSMKDFFILNRTTFYSSLIMGIFIYILGQFIEIDYLKFLIQGLSGIVIYIFLSYIFSNEYLLDIINLLKPYGYRLYTRKNR